MPRMMNLKTHKHATVPYVYINVASIECVKPSADDPTKAAILYGPDRYIVVDETPAQVVAWLNEIYTLEEI